MCHFMVEVTDLVEGFPLAYRTVRKRAMPRVNLATVLQAWDTAGIDLTCRPLVGLLVTVWQKEKS